jgi:hypothetical protein
LQIIVDDGWKLQTNFKEGEEVVVRVQLLIMVASRNIAQILWEPSFCW